MLLGSHAMTVSHSIIVFLDRLLGVLNHVLLPSVCLTFCISFNLTRSIYQTFCCGEYVVDLFKSVQTTFVRINRLQIREQNLCDDMKGR